MTPLRTKSPHAGFRPPRSCLAAAALWILALAPPPAHGTLSSIATHPESPTTCDTTVLFVSGTLPSPCHTLIAAEFEGPLPLENMGPVPAYRIRIRLTVQEPDPRLGRPCPAVLEPYRRPFGLDNLPFGRYFVTATEYLVPPYPDSTSAPIDSSTLSASFSVTQAPDCPPAPSCYLLDFGRRAIDQPRAGLCDAIGPPGGTACIGLTLHNRVPVGGLQTIVDILDPRLAPGTPLPSGLFRPTSVEVTERAAGFQVAWTAEGARAKILLYSSSGAVIEPGEGPILRVCYAIAADAPEGAYFLRYMETVVADPEGVALPPCPTFAPIVGRLCVASPGCDLNGDGVSDILDILRLVRCVLADSAEACPDSVAAKADCNGDGGIDIRDVICCVRRILAGGGVGSGGGEPADSTGATRIGFTGPVRWVTPVQGRATIEINPGEEFGGIQFGIAVGAAEVRLRSLRLLDPSSGYQLESSIEPDQGIAHAMIFPTGVGAEGRLRIELEVEPTLAAVTGGRGEIALFDMRSGTRSAEALAVRSPAPTAEVPAGPAEGAPAVMAARPNPFSTETEITYALPSSRHVTLRVYGANGRLLKTLVDAMMPAGVHRARWNGRDAKGRAVGSGIYFFKFSTGDLERTHRILRLR